MFERIRQYADTLASTAGESRRGFLGRLGNGAIAVAGVVGGLLLWPTEAGATVCGGACTYRCPDGTQHATNCGSRCRCALSIKHSGMTCSLFRSSCKFV
jgi:hypothetical protein